MKLRFFSLIWQACNFASVCIHGIERVNQRVRVWAWTRATKENLRTCQTRAARVRLS